VRAFSQPLSFVLMSYTFLFPIVIDLEFHSFFGFSAILSKSTFTYMTIGKQGKDRALESQEDSYHF
jgi:hypothetical protein